MKNASIFYRNSEFLKKSQIIVFSTCIMICLADSNFQPYTYVLHSWSLFVALVAQIKLSTQQHTSKHVPVQIQSLLQKQQHVRPALNQQCIHQTNSLLWPTHQQPANISHSIKCSTTEYSTYSINQDTFIETQRKQKKAWKNWSGA